MPNFDKGEKAGASVVIFVCIAIPRPSFLVGNDCFDFARACYQPHPTKPANLINRFASFSIIFHFFLRAGASVLKGGDISFFVLWIAGLTAVAVDCLADGQC
jgi:hypothetical protein